ncbi:MAG: hypothetical protein ACJ8MO_28205, partial [Bacillus sp. (in: firmicutes)]
MATIGIEPYLQVRFAKNPVYDPIGHKISFIADYTGLPQVWELNLGEGSEGWPVQTAYTKE